MIWRISDAQQKEVGFHADISVYPRGFRAVILGIDLGTSSLKAVVVRADGGVVASSTAGYPVDTPRPGWSETDPQVWWHGLVAAVRGIPESVRQQVTAIGLSGQMHSLVLCTAAGVPVRPAILWSDARSESVLPAFRSLAEVQRRRLANPIVAGMTGPSLLWLTQHEADVVARARWALQPKDWLRLKLTGIAATDPSDASATLLYDLEADGWAYDITHSLGLPADLLPPIQASDACAGELLVVPAQQLGLQPGIPIATGGADAAAAALGAGLVSMNDAQLNLGTGAQIIVIGRTAGGLEPAVHHYRSALAQQHYTMAAMQNTGLALHWVRSTLGFSWEELYAAFQPESIQADLVFLPYLSGERTPLMNSALRTTWTGLGLHHTRSDLAAAALAGVALSIGDGFHALQDTGAGITRLRVTGGGSQASSFTQFLCSLLGVPFELTQNPDASGAGAARLAARMRGQDSQTMEPVERVPGPQVEPRPLTPEAVELIERFHQARQRLHGAGSGEG